MGTDLEVPVKQQGMKMQEETICEPDQVEDLQIASPLLSEFSPTTYRNRLLQKRQRAFEKAPSISRFSPRNNRHQRPRASHEEEWISDDPSIKVADDPTMRSTINKKLRNHRRSSSSLQEQQASRMRITPNSRSKKSQSILCADQNYIESLERENEELMSQVANLTKERAAIAKDLQTRLKNATDEIWMLQQQLLHHDSVPAKVTQSRVNEVTPSRPRHTLSQAARFGHTRRFSENICSSSDLEGQIVRLLEEKEISNSTAKKRDEELLRIKKRNAVLAEQILEKRSLEFTIEGQNRYLAELSTALDESRRTGQSEPARSPPPLISPKSPEYTSYASFFAAHATLRSRPVSFDGTRIERRLVPESLLPDNERDLVSCSVKSQSAGMTSPRPSTPPTHTMALESDASARKELAVTLCSSPISASPVIHLTTQSLRKTTYPCIRPSLQRNESSLWQELKDEDQTSNLSSSDTTLQDEPTDLMQRAVALSSDLKSDIAEMRKATVTEYAIKFSGVTLSSSMRVALAGWDWLRFWALLMAAIALLVVEGPASLLGEPQSHIRVSLG